MAANPVHLEVLYIRPKTRVLARKVPKVLKYSAVTCGCNALVVHAVKDGLIKIIALNKNS